MPLFPSPVPFLALEWLEPGRSGPDFDARLGEGLARLHRAGAPGFGWSEPNFLATLPQDNTPERDWPSFYARRRLAPLLRRAQDAGLAAPDWSSAFERLYARLPELAGPPEPPARLHGDLWSGNVHRDPSGAPCLIDPAVYGGHREMDLAMLTLFGSPSPAFFAAYDRAWPLAVGWRERLPLWQLYPLLAHVCLFGAGYVGAVDGRLRGLLD
jgi:fructosamine-3-kinase